MNLRDFGAVQLLSGWVGHSSKLRSRSARAAVLGLAGATAFAAQLGFAATTTINTLLDTDNNTATGCAVATLNGAVNGVESIVNTIVIADATGYRTQSITMQTASAVPASPRPDSSATPRHRLRPAMALAAPPPSKVMFPTSSCRRPASRSALQLPPPVLTV